MVVVGILINLILISRTEEGRVVMVREEEEARVIPEEGEEGAVMVTLFLVMDPPAPRAPIPILEVQERIREEVLHVRRRMIPR